MENQIPEELKTKRSDILLKLDKEHRKEYEAVLVGTEQEVLFRGGGDDRQKRLVRGSHERVCENRRSRRGEPC